MKKVLTIVFALLFAPAINAGVVAGSFHYEIDRDLGDQCFNLGVSAIKASRAMIENHMTKEQAMTKLDNIPHWKRDEYPPIYISNLRVVIETVYANPPKEPRDALTLGDNVYNECIDQLERYSSI